VSAWHVWGDFCHTMPQRIGSATLVAPDSGAARKSAEANGFDFKRRLRNGFEPWAAEFSSDDDRDVEFAFAAYPTVRGWKRR
jgi:hypothetical protein